MDRLKSKFVWVAILSQVIIILNVFGFKDVGTVETVVGSILSILVIIGVLNNPTDSNHF
jgi:phi LC3 family holin